MLKVSFDGQTIGFSSHTFLCKLDLLHNLHNNVLEHGSKAQKELTPCSKANRRACMSLRKQKPGLRDNGVSPTLTSP